VPLLLDQAGVNTAYPYQAPELLQHCALLLKYADEDQLTL